jgi:uncharacterized protein involved in outer membrane biogenesis
LAAGGLLALAAGFAVGEQRGWPFLAGPLERQAGQWLQRTVRLSAETPPDGAVPAPLRVQLLGGLRLSAPQLWIAAPDWSTAPHLLQARDVDLELRYGDLWRASRGEPLRIRRLQAASLDAVLERRADGRASWQFGAPARPNPAAPPPLPVVETLLVPSGQLTVSDASLALTLDVRFSLVDGTAAAQPPTAPVGPTPAMSPTGSALATAPAKGLQVSASGRFGEFPVKLTGTSNGVLPWVSEGAPAAPLSLKATVGRAEFEFQGTVGDQRPQGGIRGRYSLRGPSLAEVGDPIGVTLPTTAAFHASGRLVQQPGQWQVLVDEATVGASQLTGAFTYTTGGRVPLLAGRLGGRRLLLADLAPAVGATPQAPLRAGRAHKVLPNRPFDLAALRLMNANVLVSIAEVDFNHPRLVPLRPLQGHLQLTGGVLRLTDLDARTGQGRLRGDLQLDGRGDDALWQAKLAWSGVQLEQWIQQPRAGHAPPFIAGRLKGEAELTGQGRSTAGILASLSGRVHTELRGGAVSHLAMEAGGLDLAQSLGVWIQGDDALQVHCAVASLVAEHGVFRPKVMVLDTDDSTVLVDGTLSLATETMDLRAVVTPKDFSPLALRAPLRLHGSFSAPVVDVDASVLGRKAAVAVVLAFINPLAALIPLIDPGDNEAAARAASGCQPLLQRAKAKPAIAKPTSAAAPR